MSKSIIVSLKALTVSLLACSPVFGADITFSPLFQEVSQYETVLTTNSDRLDIYYPTAASEADNLPSALFLQGALVDKADYSDFARTVASYGFVVVVPNHFQTAPGIDTPGLFPEVSQIDAAIDYLETENSNSTSPLNGILDTDSLSLLGHSQGGAVGLSAIGNYCIPFLCNETNFTLPEEVKSGIFYGAFLREFEGEFLPIDNQQIPLGLISGSRDGVATPEEIRTSYELIQNAPNALITVEGANHYSITNEDNLRDPLRPTLEQDIANETIALWTSLFLRASVLGDETAADFIYNSGDVLDDNVTVISKNKSKSVPESSNNLIFLALGIVSILLTSKSKM